LDCSSPTLVLLIGLFHAGMIAPCQLLGLLHTSSHLLGMGAWHLCLLDPPRHRSTCLINTASLRFLCLPRNRQDLSAGVRSSSPGRLLSMMRARQDHAHPSAARGCGGRRPDAHIAARVARALSCRRAHPAIAQGRMRPQLGRALAARRAQRRKPVSGPVAHALGAR